MGEIRLTPLTRGKVAQTDYDFWLTQSEDRCLYCLSKRQIAIILTALPMSEWRTRWFSPTLAEPDMDLIQAEIAKLETELMADHCDLDTAITQIMNDITTINNNVININTDITTINTNVVNINNSLTIVENTVNQISVDVNNVFIQNNYLNLNVVNVFFTYTMTSNDRDLTAIYARYNGFCLAMLAWIASAANAYAQSQFYSNLWTLTLNSFEAHYGVLNIPPGVHAAILGGGGLPETDVDAAFADFAAVDDVACAMITYLQNLIPSALTFSQALSAYTPPPYPDHRSTIAQILAATLVLSGSFDSWLGIDEFYYQQALAAAPTDFDCIACTPSVGCAVPSSWDFSNLELVPWLFARGGPVTDVGIVGEQLPGDLNFGWDASIYFPTPCISLATHHMHFFASQQFPGGNAYTVELYYLLAGVPTLYSQANVASISQWPTIDDLSFVIPAPPGGPTIGIYRIRVYVNTQFYGNATSHPSNASKLTKITFTI